MNRNHVKDGSTRLLALTVWILIFFIVPIISASAQKSIGVNSNDNTENQWKYIQFDYDGSSSAAAAAAARNRAGGYPNLATAADFGFGRPARQLSLTPLASNSLQSAAVSINDYGYGSSDTGIAVNQEFGGYASAGSHGGGYGYGGGGGGGGHGHGKKDCNSALGLLGVLGLMSFLQSVLQQLTSTTAAPMGRRKRDADADQNLNTVVVDGLPDDTDTDRPDVDVDRVTLHILPHLIRIGQVLDSVAPLNCSLYAICRANHILASELEPSQGQIVGRMISKEILNMMSRKYGPASMKEHLVEISNAAITGRAAGVCKKRYQQCGQLPQTNFPGFISKHARMRM